MKSIKLLAFLFIATLAFTGCSKDKTPPQVNAEEVITTMTITLTPASGTPIVLKTQDLDGNGPKAPEVTVSGRLAPNATYNGAITLLNETETPAGNVTDEVKAEDKDHQFFYSATGANATFAYAGANDGNGNPVGLSFTLTTGAASSGKLTFTLRHKPNKTAAGVKNGDITNAGGETDIQATFDVTIATTPI